MNIGLRRGLWILALTFGVAALAALVTASMGCLSGCSSIGYYAQGAAGHLRLVAAAKPVDAWTADAATPQALRERLLLSQRMRDFAVERLALPDNASYRRYADLQRSAAVWNVVAAPEFSLELKKWCFPIVGCVGYRGYFDPAAAEHAGDELRAQGMEVLVYPVPAYSSLGWFSDPLLNTFVNWPEIDLARLIFHELAHQVAYAPGDTAFNESFATAVERLGGALWLQSRGAAADAITVTDARRTEFRALVARYRVQLKRLYEGAAPDAERREQKAAIYAGLRAEYEALKAGAWSGYAGYDEWFSRVNNAALGVQAAYDANVPWFERLFEQQGRDFPRFYAEVKRLATLPQAERDAALNRP